MSEYASPPTKRVHFTEVTDFCLIYQKKGGDLVKNPVSNSLQKLLESVSE